MKISQAKCIFCPLILFFIICNSTAQTWQIVGQNGFSGYAYQPTIALTSTGIPYVAYTDYAVSNGKAVVMGFIDTSWQYIGQHGFSDSTGADVCIVIGKNDTPYVAYIDAADSNAITVKKFDGSVWVTLGLPGFSGPVNYICITVDNNGIPYVAYSDESDSNKASVIKYVSGAWEYVGGRGFSVKEATLVSIALDSNNVPYVAYGDDADSGNATVMKFNGSFWINVGKAGFTGVPAGFTRIALDNNGTPYVTYINDLQSNYKVNVMRFIDTAWVHVGSPDFSPGIVGFPDIAINKAGVPYVVFEDDSNVQDPVLHGASVMKFDGSNWIYVGAEDFSNCEANGTYITIDPTGIPYVAYTDENGTPKIVVEKYTLSTGIGTDRITSTPFNLYPNPTNGKLEIDLQNIASGTLQLTITDISGQTLMHENINPQVKNELYVSGLPAGLYFIQLQDGQQNLVKKFIKE